MNKTKIVIVDDHRLFGEGLAHLLNKEPDFEVIAIFPGGEAMLESIEIHQADLLLIDLNLHGKSGITIISEMKRFFRQLKIICISMTYERSVSEKLSALGACGYFPKNMEGADLVAGIKKIIADEKIFYCEPECTPQNITVWKDDFRLTDRELEILNLIKQGKTTKQIADIVYRSTFTINAHRKNIIKKLNLKNASELVVFASKM